MKRTHTLIITYEDGCMSAVNFDHPVSRLMLAEQVGDAPPTVLGDIQLEAK